MAKVPMRRISVYALKNSRKAILEYLQRKGVVEIIDVAQGDSAFEKADTAAARAVFEKNRTTALAALDVLDRVAPVKKPMFSVLQGRESVSVEDYNAFSEEVDSVMKKSYRILQLSKEVSEENAEILRLKTQIDALTPWLPLDVSMRFRETKRTAAFIGTLPGEFSEEGLLARLAEEAPEAGKIEAEVISSSREQTCLFLICLKEEAEALEAGLRNMGFSRPAAPTKYSPAERKTELEGRIKESQEQIEKAEKEILSYTDLRNKIKFAADYNTMREEKYAVISQLSQSKHTFVLQGYISQRNADEVEKELSERYGAAVELEIPEEEEDVPVLLRNNKFTEPVEGVLESFSLPGKGEIDPTSIMAFFYYALFGLMLSDAAYGLLISVVCGFALWKFKNMEPSWNKSLRMFFFCGLATVFWGVMFSSYFGDVVDVVSRTFFGVELTVPPVWFIPLNDPMRMLLISFAIGVLHLFTGLIIQFYQLWRAKKYTDAIFDVAFWMILLLGLIVILLSTDMFGQMFSLNLSMPPIVGTIAAIAAGVSALGIIATAGRESRSPFKRILKGLYGLYNITGYLSDILSYSRLLALGLATGVIASVINKMGSMMGGNAVGVIVFILVFLLGHTLNIAINLLGAYVHTNRLQFVEFFGKFYEGGGRKFNPFAVNTKFYKVREDMNYE